MGIGFGLVGPGMIGKVHAEAILSIPGAQLPAVCGRDENKTREFAERFNAAAYTDYDAFLAHPGLSIVTICTPSGTHAELGIRAAQAGKHVIVEKPIETTLARADALIEACEESRVRLGVIFQSRLLPAAARIKKAVDEGRLGRLFLGDAYVKWYRAPQYYAEGSWHGTLKLDGGGALINQAIHTVDLLQWIMGPAETVFAFKGALRYPHIEGEDTLTANVRFRNGALGVIEAATSIAPGFRRRLEISGERGTIILDGDDISAWEIEGEAADVGAGEQITDGSSNPAAISNEGHRRQIADFIEAVENGKEPVVSGREGRKALQLIEAIYRAADEGRPVEC
ncbi:MAG: Gfo/Idh/MocA family oxidoreductase [Acidobacteria bacterium]|nr:Gfo/Idh/MocA family oxidoreductase [Acidobacteriota bacterium]MCW5970448.1 Gfo/Idh/MocA family oxidoreductase [Blastocatellales bacterium]